jgi:predicted nucleic acid-binding protein
VILADTDVLIDALRGREPSRSRIAEALERGALATTTITAFELTSGARSEKQETSITDLLAGLAVLPFDSEAARSASRIRRALEAEGRTIGMADYLIAGITTSRDLPLLTRNRKHFERVPGLALIEP